MARLPFRKVLEGLGGAGLMGVHLLLPILHHYRRRWGATDDELRQKWPGDELVPNPRGGYTHAITIHTPASEVWPWVAQIGQEKGGFYSYEALENLVGCEINNADTIEPAWQMVKAGDRLRLHPQVALPVAVAEEGRHFAIHGVMNTRTGEPVAAGEPLPPHYAAVSWLFAVVEDGPERCRFISRWRTDYPAGWKNEILTGRYGLEAVAAVMDFKMLREVKARAERSAHLHRNGRMPNGQANTVVPDRL